MGDLAGGGEALADGLARIIVLFGSQTVKFSAHNHHFATILLGGPSWLAHSLPLGRMSSLCIELYTVSVGRLPG
jgi:hypothetical protein